MAEELAMRAKIVLYPLVPLEDLAPADRAFCARGQRVPVEAGLPGHEFVFEYSVSEDVRPRPREAVRQFVLNNAIKRLHDFRILAFGVQKLGDTASKCRSRLKESERAVSSMREKLGLPPAITPEYSTGLEIRRHNDPTRCPVCDHNLSHLDISEVEGLAELTLKRKCVKCGARWCEKFALVGAWRTDGEQANQKNP